MIIDTAKLTNPAIALLKRAFQAVKRRRSANSDSTANQELHEYVKDLTLIVDNLSTEVERLREQLNSQQD